jgi:hypothetical protein
VRGPHFRELVVRLLFETTYFRDVLGLTKTETLGPPLRAFSVLLELARVRVLHLLDRRVLPFLATHLRGRYRELSIVRSI